jgi:hypothetical protein
MASIYENAFVTLAATYALDSEGGLFAVKQSFTPQRLAQRSDIYVRERRKANGLPLTYRHFSSSTTSQYIRDFPLLSRAWVYQERRLSQ